MKITKFATMTTPKIIDYINFWPKWYGPEFSDIFERLLEGIELTKPASLFSVFGNTQPFPNRINLTFSGEKHDRADDPGFHAHLVHRASDLAKNTICFPYFTYYPIKHNLWPVLQTPRIFPCEKDRFCLFVVSNPLSPSHIRNQVMSRLSHLYKKVDSCGLAYNNTGERAPGYQGEYNPEYHKFIRRYKFMICFENQSADYYCTEKLYNAYIGGAVPIYWGSPKVKEWFNPESMILLEDTSDEAVQRLIDRVRELDQDDEKYNAIYKQPLLRDGRIPRDMDPVRIKEELHTILRKHGVVKEKRNARRILVTGGSGLVGTALAEAAKHHEDVEMVFASSKDGDLRIASELCALIQRNMPLDGIVHLAANVGGLFKNMKYPVEMLEDNLLMNTNVLREAHTAGIQNVVCMLSTCIFPDAPPSFPLDSEMLHQGPPHESNEGYAYAKRMMEVACRAYQRQYGRRYFCIIPCNIYGPNDNFHLEDAHVIPALIHKCFVAKTSFTSLHVHGDGNPVRQFIYSEDLANIILHAYTSYQDIATPILACPEEEVRIADVVRAIVDALQFDMTRVKYENNVATNGQQKKTTRGDVFEDIINFTPLEKGIMKTVEWFVKNKDHARM